ncbi:zinc finger SWIM domain-containing protein 6-like [Panicum hallii]|uniref:zinc finger SWIM domain-containing protein 6-like n=1 Tax=Panicum hallii TaxID=206008 RepID=UPI000DF4EF96|nr:zinc finger SWIM domain-containing protein 6-like [Panicum hallii]
MSRNNGKVGSKLQELRLSLSRSRGGPSSGGATGQGGGVGVGGGGGASPRRLSSSSSSTASPPSSCVSSEGSPEAAGAPMILAGCPRCMMYVMLSREDPRCPKCHSTVLLDFNDGPGAKSKGRRG